MENQYSTLQTLAEAVKELPNPTAYFCTTREMILRCSYDWATIYAHLQLLEIEKLVEIKNADTIQFAITKAGLQKAREMQELQQLHTGRLFK
ncbi:MAG: hypothetical protein V4539_08785 [Bacteroidota bacterium]